MNALETPPASDDGALLKTARFPGLTEKLGGIAGLVPFFFHATFQTTENGQVTSYCDYVAIAGGTVAVLMAVIGFLLLRTTPPESRVKRLGAGVGLLALGLYQLLHGLGKI